MDQSTVLSKSPDWVGDLGNVNYVEYLKSKGIEIPTVGINNAMDDVAEGTAVDELDIGEEQRIHLHPHSSPLLYKQTTLCHSNPRATMATYSNPSTAIHLSHPQQPMKMSHGNPRKSHGNPRN